MRISDWSSDVCSSDLFGKDAIGRFLDSLRRLRALDPRAKCVADRRVERRAALEQVERLDPLAPVAVPAQRVETLHAVRAAGIGSDLRRQIGRAHVWTPVTNAHLVCRLLLENNKPKSRQ